jgi:spore maturation protein CgeB
MRIAIVNTDYQAFLSQLYGRDPRLLSATYAEQIGVRMATGFGVADAYSSALRELGHEAIDVYINNRPLQEAWARERGLSVPGDERRFAVRLRRGCIPWPVMRTRSRWMITVLEAQMTAFHPDVVLIQDMGELDEAALRRLRPLAPVLVGQHAASELPEDRRWTSYDLVVSSFPPTVERFRARGVRAELHRLAFDPRVLPRLPPPGPRLGATFVGSLMGIHRSRIAWLEALCQRQRIDVFSPDIDGLRPDSPIRRHSHGPAWGLDMYRVLRDSLLTLNHHGDVPAFSNNLRLYEATGVGALLLTEAHANLPDLFAPGREVAVYDGVDGCEARMRHLADNPDERDAIARAGQARTLRDHTYAERMADFVRSVDPLVSARGQRARGEGTAHA